MLKLRIKDVCLECSYPFIAICAVIIISGEFTGYLYCALAVIIHELGHLSAMKLCNVSVTGISISSFNIIINEKSRHIVKPLHDFLITLSGPLFNIVAFAIMLGFAPVVAFVNLLLGVFNLLPAAGLDGGQVLYMVLIKRLSPRSSAFIVDLITFIISLPLFALGILVLFQSKYNFSLLFISLYLILNVFFKNGKYV